VLPSLVLAAAFSTPVAAAPSAWLTVTGDPSNPAVNTIQVDPTPLEAHGNVRAMLVRVSRSQTRTSWDGVPYRSYESRVLFDCQQMTARYQRIRYFMAPGWAGASHRTVDYSQGEPRWMLFRDVAPNPNQRIIHAACNGMIARK